MHVAFAAGLDLLLPPRCAACGTVLAQEQAFCEICWQSVLPLTAACPRCGQPGPRAHCAECLRHPPPFASVSAAFLYGGQLATALLRLKYARAGHLARPLGRLLAPSLAGLTGPQTLLVPVPLHPRRLRQRGYNQAALLARQASSSGLARWALRRLRFTAPQAGLDRQQRIQNLQGAFGADARVRGLPVLLVDDVLTTGATACACSEALLGAGAASVQVVVLARAGNP